MDTIRGSMYDFPAYYDLVYGSDWRAEYQFLCGSFERYADGPVRRVFEPACGTGRLLFRLGKAGYDVSGLDLNPRAVEYCRRRFCRHHVKGRVWTGDMTDFALAAPVDAAFNMINSFRHLADAASARRHLELMARALRRGGIYVLGLHVTPTRGVPTSEESWEARRGHLVVRTRLWVKQRDRRRRLEICGVSYDVVTPSRHLRLTDEVSFRTYTWAQLRGLLREVSAWELAATHDFSYDLSVTVPVTSTSEDLVLVLRKK